MLHQKRAKTGLAIIVLTLLSHASFAIPVQEQKALDPIAEEKGLNISREVDQRDMGWTDSTADMLMLLRNEQGHESVREIKIKSLEQDRDGDKSLTIFNQPRDIKGTAFLSYSHVGKADDQWLYLPALKRVKRISSKNKSGPFMGSEFSFEDFSSFEVEKYTYKYVGSDASNGIDSFMVEQYPIDENSGYTKRVVWVDKQDYLIQKIDYYDRKNSLLKTLSYRNYQQYLNKYWRADSMHMVNHQSGKSTELKWKNYQFQTGLKDSDFNRNSLKRTR